MQAVIQAGGFGTRLRAINPDLPKPLFELAGKPIIFRQIDVCLEQQIDDIIVIAGYLGDVLEQAIQKQYSGKVRVVRELSPLGTGGCLSQVKSFIKDRAFVFSGDILFDFNFQSFLTFHLNKKAWISIVAQPNNYPLDSDLVDIDKDGKLLRIFTRPHAENLLFRNLTNASMNLLEKAAFMQIPDSTPLNFEKDFLTSKLLEGKLICAYLTDEYLQDVGTPDRLIRATKYLSLTTKRTIQKFKLSESIDSGDNFKLKAPTLQIIRRCNDSFVPVHMLCDISNIEIEEVARHCDTALGKLGLKIDQWILLDDCLHR